MRISSPAIAEMEKILERSHTETSISILVNELAILCNKMGISLWEVIDAAKTNIQFQTFYPGPGLSGHCIPLDPYYLTWKARVLVSSSMIENSMIINDKDA